MGTGKINVWIREPNDCSVAEMDGYAWARPCCGLDDKKIYQTELKNGYAEIEVPPGCYIVDASWKPGCCGDAKETMITVECGETVCVNLIREWAGEPIRRIIPLSIHAEEAGISKDKIEAMVDFLKKVADTVPHDKRKFYSEKELNLKRELSDSKHKAAIAKYESTLRGK